MRRKDAKVVVMGTGIGGSGVAALLKKSGFENVTILERNSFPGGKAASFEKDGFIYDTGVHWVGRGERGPLGEISKRVGGNLRFHAMEPALKFSTGGYTAILNQDMGEPEWHNVVREIGVRKENEKDAIRFIKDATRERTLEEISSLDKLRLEEYVKSFTDDIQLFRLAEGFAGLYMVISPAHASAGEFCLCFSTQFNLRNLSYPYGAMRQMPIDYLEQFEKMGGVLKYNTEVEEMVIENGKVKGVEAGGFYPADVVISNNGAKETLELAGYENFPKDYVEKVNSMKLSFGAVSVKYAVRGTVVEPQMNFYFPNMEDPRLAERQTGIFLPVPSIADPDLAPEGCHILLAGSLVPPKIDNEGKYKFICDMVLDRIENTMNDLYPDLEKSTIWKMRTDSKYIAQISGRKTGEVIGISQSFTQVGENRLKCKTPVSGLFLVGADAGGRGIGTEMAADSALNLADELCSVYPE